MRSVPTFLGGLNSHQFEVEVIVKEIYHLILLHSLETSTKILLK